ncbi:hypothetical protein [Ochrobactrum sp. SFR4]
MQAAQNMRSQSSEILIAIQERMDRMNKETKKGEATA